MNRVLVGVALAAATTVSAIAVGAGPAAAALPTCNSLVYIDTGSIGPVAIPGYNSSNISCVMGKRAQSVAVTNLQRELNHCFGPWIGPQLKEDGIFGSLTETALERAQSHAGTDPDGVYGPNTRHAFNLSRGWWTGTYCTGLPGV
jgi:peptidoglycan hydrolase-like protein with peptidoglycan-binding domain